VLVEAMEAKVSQEDEEMGRTLNFNNIP